MEGWIVEWIDSVSLRYSFCGKSDSVSLRYSFYGKSDGWMDG